MAYAVEENFELGHKGVFAATETDTGGRLFFPGPDQLRSDAYRIAPHRGGSIMQIGFSKSAADAYIQGGGGVPFAIPYTVPDPDATTMHDLIMVQAYRLNLATALDSFDILRLIKAGPATEAALKITWDDEAGMVLDLNGQQTPFAENQWNAVEVETKVGSGGWVKVRYAGNTLAWLPTTVANIIDVQLGVIGQQGSISQGSICFDRFVRHTSRLYPPQGPVDAMNLDNTVRNMRKPGFAFVGPGEIESAQLTAELGVNCRVDIYDTAKRNIYTEDDRVETLTATVEGMTKSNQRRITVRRGAWVVPSGDDPLVVMQLGTLGDPGYFEDYGGGMVDEDMEGDEEG